MSRYLYTNNLSYDKNKQLDKLLQLAENPFF